MTQSSVLDALRCRDFGSAEASSTLRPEDVVVLLLLALQPALGVFADEDLHQLVGDVPVELDGTAARVAVVELLRVLDGVTDEGQGERRHVAGTNVLADEQLALGEPGHGRRPTGEGDVLAIGGVVAFGNFAHDDAPLKLERIQLADRILS